jgi:hypothetical protein
MKKQAMIWMGACVLGVGLSGCLKTPEIKEYQPRPLPLEKRVKREKLALKETKKAPVVKKTGLAGFALSIKKTPKSYTEKRVGGWIQSHVPGGYTRPGRMVRRRRVAASRGGRTRYRYKRRPPPKSTGLVRPDLGGANPSFVSVGYVVLCASI